MGGAQKFLYELVTHLNQEKYDLLIAAGSSPTGREELFNELKRKNIKTIKINNFSNTFSFKNLLAFLEIFKIIIKTKPDVVYLLSSEAGFLGSTAGSFYKFLFHKNLKIIYRIGGWAFKEPRNIFIKKIYLWAEKFSAFFKDVIIVNSEFDRQLAIKNNIARPHKIITIYNGLDFDKLNFLTKKEALSFLKEKIYSNSNFIIYNSILVVTIANFYKNKGLDYLISAAAKLKGLDLKFIIIGNGFEKKNLEELTKKNDLKNKFFFIGYISDAYKYLKAFDIFVLPSIKEGQPWTILEAMAAGIPIIATNIAGIPEMIENKKSGLLVEPADSDALAEAIEKILTHSSSACIMAQNALMVVKEKFNLENTVIKNEELF